MSAPPGCCRACRVSSAPGAALTGDRLKTADAVAAGIATHHVRSERFADLTDALCGNVPVDATLAAFAEPPAQGR